MNRLPTSHPFSTTPSPGERAVPSKAELRDAFRAYRRGLSGEAYVSKSATIASRVKSLPALQAASTVHVYWPMTSTHEVDTRSLIAALTAQGVDVVLPVVTSFTDERPQMEHRRYDGPQSLAPNRWGVMEPVDTPRVDASALDVVVVPALGAGRNGHRIGHGKGYYDAFLATVDVPRICCVYDACLVPVIPADEHDVPVTTVVTEASLVTSFAPEASSRTR